MKTKQTEQKEVFIFTARVSDYKTEKGKKDFINKYFIYENDDAMFLLGNFRTLEETKKFAKENNLIITN